MHIIHIGGEATDYVKLTVFGREFPDAIDFWDANWLTCDVATAAGAFRGAFRCTIRNQELEKFRSQLEQLYRCLTGDASLQTLEGWIDLRIQGDGRGHLDAHCRLCEDMSRGNTLEFRLTFDQTYLPPVLRQLAEVTSAYPVLGQKLSLR